MHFTTAAGLGTSRFLLQALATATAWASILAAGLTGARAQGPESVPVPLGADLQALVNANPPGTRYVLAAGVHRGLTVIPKDGDVITGEPGAVLNGCLALESWEREGDWWVHTAPVLVPMVSPNGIDCADFICLQPQDFYLDGVRLKPVASLSGVISGKEWHLDYTTGKVYLAVDPTGLLAEFGGPARTAIDCAPFNRPPALGVVIEDLTIEKYPCPPQIGAVRLGGGGTIRRCTVLSSHSYGVQLMNGPALVQDCYLADNGMCGIGGTGVGATIEGCEIARNVWPIYAGKAWDSAGVKLAGTRDTIFRRNYVHHNHGPGFWVDIKTTLLTVEDNIIEFNDWEGILVEISEQAVVRRNICRWNGVLHRRALWGAQICVQNSSSVEIHSNFLETGQDDDSPLGSPWGSRQGIIVINQIDRAWDEGVFQGDFSVHEILVRNNVQVMPSGGHDGVDYGTLGWDTYEDFLGAELEWRDNRYLAGQPLEHYWSWRRQPNWDATVGKWLAWEDWLTEQDDGSTLERIGPFDYPPTGLAQHPLILATTGNNYAALKAQLTRRPAWSAADRDEDGLPDEWERELVSSLDELSGSGDPDGDGLTTAAEFAAGTDPLRADTDGDQLPDAWEVSRGLNPLAFDSHLDEDGDGRSVVAEWQDGTALQTPESLDLPAAEANLRVWLTPTAHLTTDTVGNLTRWLDSGPLGLSIGWLGSPRLAGASPTGVRLVDPDITMGIPGHDATWGTPSSGCTLTFVFQPTEVELTREWRAVLTNEVYLEQGFRLRLESGHLVFSAGQSGGSLNMAGHTRLEAGRSYLITVSIEPDGRGGSLYLDGRLEAYSPVGFVVPSRTGLMLKNIGGVVPQPSLFGDIVVFNRRLSHRERRSLEGFLQQKYVTGVPAGVDDDRDGLPNAWETANQIDALTPNALADDDRDGATNLTEWERGLDPRNADTDGDGLPDGWEIRWQTNPLVADDGNDPDEDGLSNREEFENGTDPLDSNVDPLALDFNKVRLWWRANHGLESAEAGLAQWRNSAPGGGSGRPPEAAPVALSPDPWNGHPVVRLSDNPVVADGPVDLSTELHPAGLTMAAAVRPPASGPSAGFRRLLALGEIVIGVEAGNLVLRNEGGSVSATASVPVPAGPFIVSCLIAEAPAPARLMINGIVVAEATGLTPPASTLVSLGGPVAWPADIAEVIVHAGVLTPLHRRFVERVLEGKWLGTGPLTGDADADGLADWWEHEACTQATVPDATDDSDWNGETNLAAFQAGRPGFVWVDADADGLHDDWERFHGLDPARDDAVEDPDQDGLPNAHEQALASHPRTLEADAPWSISPAPATPAGPIVLSLRSSQRSWSQRARWESSTSLEPGSWQWLAPGRVTGRGPGASLLEEILVIPGTGEGSDFSWLRLRLLRE